MSKLLDAKGVQERLGISESTLFRLLRNGELKGFKVGAPRGQWRVEESDIEEYIAREREEIETKRHLLEIRHAGLTAILDQEGEYWATHGFASEWEATRAWILDFLGANPRLEVRWEPERGVVFRGALQE